MAKDLVGLIFGNNLLVQSATKRRHPTTGEIYWRCKCSCGNHGEYVTSDLTKGTRTSCGCRIKKKLKVNQKTPFNADHVKRYKNKNGKVPIGKICQTKRDQIIKKYIEGSTIKELSEEFKVDITTLSYYIKDYRKKLNLTYELNQMLRRKHIQIDPAKLDVILRKRFAATKLHRVVSGDTSSTLTNEEILYSIVFVATGSNSAALRDSGFLEALDIQDAPRQKLLGMYLKEKPNVAAYIRSLQEKNIASLDVSKNIVQSELLTQISQLKELVALDGSSPAQRAQLLKAIELLGKTIGAFQDNIRIQEVNPGDALDLLVSKAKEEIAAGSYMIEDSTDDEDYPEE